MLGLLVKIGGDSSPLNAELNKAKGVAATGGETVGKAFGAQFKAGMMRFIGAGAIISAIKKAAGDALTIQSGALKLGVDAEAFQELTKAAELLGMSVDELKEVAPGAAEEFSKLMDSIRKGGGILDSDTVTQLADTADAMNELWAQMQPALGLFVKSVSWIIGQGQRVATANAGLGMAAYGTAKRMITGNDDIQRAGVELYREARGASVPFGASAIKSSERRKAASEFSTALRRNRSLQAAQNAAASEAFQNGVGNMGAIPMLGPAFSEMTKAMQATADSTRKTAEEIAKRL